MVSPPGGCSPAHVTLRGSSELPLARVQGFVRVDYSLYFVLRKYVVLCLNRVVFTNAQPTSYLRHSPCSPLCRIQPRSPPRIKKRGKRTQCSALLGAMSSAHEWTLQVSICRSTKHTSLETDTGTGSRIRTTATLEQGGKHARRKTAVVARV